MSKQKNNDISIEHESFRKKIFEICLFRNDFDFAPKFKSLCFRPKNYI